MTRNEDSPFSSHAWCWCILLSISHISLYVEAQSTLPLTHSQGLGCYISLIAYSHEYRPGVKDCVGPGSGPFGLGGPGF